MRRDRVDIGGQDVRLDLVDGHGRRIARVVDRVDHVEEFPGELALVRLRECHGRPHGGVCVLAAIFAHAGNIALDVTGIEPGLVEWRIEKLHDGGVATHQSLVQRLHRRARALEAGRTGKYRPALGNRVDLAFVITCRTERRAIVEIGAPIPGAVPAIGLDRLAQGLGVLAALRRGVSITPAFGKLCKTPEHVVLEEGQPDTFAAAIRADQVHAVVPVAATDQRQAMHATGPGVFQRAQAVSVKRFGLFRTHRQVVITLFLAADRTAFDETDHFIQHAGVAGHLHVTADRQRQPQEIVGAMRAHAAVERRMPPVLDVAFGKLVRSAKQQVLANLRGRGMQHRHAVLQLVAKTVGAA